VSSEQIWISFSMGLAISLYLFVAYHICWFLIAFHQNIPLSKNRFRKSFLNLVLVEICKASGRWLWRWKAQHWICRFHTGDKSESFDSVVAEAVCEIICKEISDGQCTDEKF
jgi:hypothetical protein